MHNWLVQGIKQAETVLFWQKRVASDIFLVLFNTIYTIIVNLLTISFFVLYTFILYLCYNSAIKGCDFMTALIVAYDRNRLIGKDGGMPWYIPGELKRFRQLTENNVVIMGKNTYLSLGKPLPNRINIVLSRSEIFTGDNLYTAASLPQAVEMAQQNWPEKDIFYGGGANLYRQVMGSVDAMYITEIDAEFRGDTYFPEFDESDFTKEIDGHFESTVPYTYVTYRKNSSLPDIE